MPVKKTLGPPAQLYLPPKDNKKKTIIIVLCVCAAVLAVIYMITGIILGAWSTIEREKFKMFTVLGIVTNVVAFGMLSIILYAGAYLD